jgi:anti-sigma regulatory factor (Ser/Thr protein kinase)
MVEVQFTPVPAGQEDEAGAGPERRERRSWAMTATHLAPAEARQAVADYAELIDLDRRVLTDVLLCVSEAVANVALHAYPGGAAGDSLEVEAELAGRDLCVCVRDRGRGFTPALEQAPAVTTGGVPIIERLARAFHIVARAGGGMEIVMRFSADAPREHALVPPHVLRHQLRHARRARRYG